MLPALREDLDLWPGPRLHDGQPTWTVHDPARNRFFQIDWMSFEMLCRWTLGEAARVAAATRAETTLQVDVEDVARLEAFLTRHELTCPSPGAATTLAERRRGARLDALRWLLHHYLFVRIPLFRPDAWLTRWSPRVDAVFGRAFLWVTLLAAILGVLGVAKQWPVFTATLVDLMTWQGIAAYAVTLVCLKALHELGHGFVAKHHGCKVPTMGIALLVLWPVAYTDTNDVWKLASRRQRLHVAAAGMATELVIAAWATLAWVLLPDGAMRSMAFLLSTTTWVSALLVNASPFMRFDGYFLLSDALGIPNLHSRSFALARWDLRERLFALGEAPPEHFAPRLRRFLIGFAWATWIYRLVLFLGIALLIYHYTFKVIGIVLLVAELGWFVALPVARELGEWKMRAARIASSTRARVLGALALALVLACFVPWPTPLSAPALLQPSRALVIYAPPHARVAALPYADGATVPAGEPLVVLESPDLGVRSARAGARRRSLAWQSAAAGLDPTMRRDWQVIEEQRVTAEAEARTVDADAARYRPTAPYAGVLRDVPPDLRVGDWLHEGEVIGRLVGTGARQVVAYVDEDAVRRIRVGDRARFADDGGFGPAPRLRVVGIDEDASRTLGEPELSTIAGGEVQVREKNGVYHPEGAQYRVLLEPDGAVTGLGAHDHTWRGRVVIQGDWEAPGLRFLRTAAAVVLRESGF